jgi:hypothetical protein
VLAVFHQLAPTVAGADQVLPRLTDSATWIRVGMTPWPACPVQLTREASISS